MAEFDILNIGGYLNIASGHPFLCTFIPEQFSIIIQILWGKVFPSFICIFSEMSLRREKTESGKR